MTRKGESQHGTRGRYVLGCRCDVCRKANAVRMQGYRAARAQARAAGVVFEGDPRVGALRARVHVQALRRAGVGLRSISAASNVSLSAVITLALGRVRTIRSSTERRILAIDEGAKGDIRIRSGPTRRILEDLLRRGFTKTEIARHLGATGHRCALTFGTKPTLRRSSAARVERLARRVAAGELAPKRDIRRIPGVKANLDELRALRDRGVELERIRREELLEELRELRRRDDGEPREDWSTRRKAS